MKVSALLFQQFVLWSALLRAGSVIAQTAAPAPATPLEPTVAILDAFRSHTIVALGQCRILRK